MKIHPKRATETEHLQHQQNAKWKILLVDDESDVIKVTKMNLKKFQYMDRKLEFIEANSAAEAKEKLAIHPDIAVALIDVVMETDDAGLRLIDYIRNDIKNSLTRLVIRTGQPGIFLEKNIIDKYDINDFKDKIELTAQKLYATVRFSLKEYHTILSMENNKRALKHVIQITPHLYRLNPDHLEQYFNWVLTQLAYVYCLGHTGMISTINAMLATIEGKEVRPQATIGDFKLDSFSQDRRSEIFEICKKMVRDNRDSVGLRAGSIVLPIKTSMQVVGFIYLECVDEFKEGDFEILQILANQCAASLDNFKLHSDLESSYDHSIDMLAIVSEFKDQTIGGHIHRIQELTRRLSVALGLCETEVELFAKASRLHDIGKVGIPDAVLCKPARLTSEEFKIITQHTTYGATILESAPSLETAKLVARSHHERWSGDGYPDGKYGKEIPLVARIVSIVDVFDALASPRPYKRAWHISDVMAEIEAGSGTQFDPIIVATFLRIFKAGGLNDMIQQYEQLGETS